MERPILNQIPPPVGTITLIGSGEMSPGMSKTHREILSAISPPLKAVFLDTPAGFQLNVDQISQKAVQYFKKHLNAHLTIASFKSAKDAKKETIRNTLGRLKDANYIFAGPGSPTYAVRNWQNTEIINALYSRLNDGAHLVFASAASIALGTFALPVYEIYKVGEDPGWISGLDLFKPYGYRMAIIPHWNNKEGSNHDTRFCFMGEPRLKILEEKLPESVAILGIDEYTALKIDFKANEGVVLGRGCVVIRRNKQEAAFESGNRFDLKLLSRTGPTESAKNRTILEATSHEDEFPDIVQWPEAPAEDEIKIPSSLIDVVITARNQLRDEKKWKIADEIRDRLLESGIILEDGQDGTTWRKG